MPRASILCVLAFSCAALLSAETHTEGLNAMERFKRQEGAVVLPSGVLYKVLRAGDGYYHPSGSSNCTVHYHGRNALSGEVFGSSYWRESSSVVTPEDVMKGWGEALQLMVEGDSWELFIPAKLAYGEAGHGTIIMPGDPISMEVELFKIANKKVPISKCDPKNKAHCSDNEKAFLTKYTDMDAASKELGRMKGIFDDGLKPFVGGWLSERIRLLEALGVEVEGAKAEL